MKKKVHKILSKHITHYSIKFRYSEKAQNLKKYIPLCFDITSKNSERFFFLIFWPSHNISTLQKCMCSICFCSFIIRETYHIDIFLFLFFFSCAEWKKSLNNFWKKWAVSLLENALVKSKFYFLAANVLKTWANKKCKSFTIYTNVKSFWKPKRGFKSSCWKGPIYFISSGKNNSKLSIIELTNPEFTKLFHEICCLFWTILNGFSFKTQYYSQNWGFFIQIVNFFRDKNQ